MEKKNLSPGLKTALELGPVVAFFVAYLWLKDEVFTFAGTEYQGFIVVTAGFIPVFLLSMAVVWKLTGHLSKMQVVTAVLVVVFGGLTVWFNDPRFFKMKPTIIYALFFLILGFGLLRGVSYLQYVMDSVLPMDKAGWMILTRRLAWFFLVLAVLNEIVWRTMSEETWVYFETFALPGAIFLFFILQTKLISDHSLDQEENETAPEKTHETSEPSD